MYTQPSAQSGKKMPQSAFPPAPIEYAFNALPNVDPAAGGGFTLKSKDGSTEITLDSTGITMKSAGVDLLFGSGWLNIDAGGCHATISESGQMINFNVKSNVASIMVEYGRVKIAGRATPALTADKNGWYIGGKKILTED